MRRFLIFAAVTVALAATAPVFAANDCGVPRTGINLAGAEFGKNVPGREGFDYRFPSQIAYFAKAGFKSLRLPIRWERLQPSLNGALDARYLEGIVTFLDIAAENGMDVLIDLHNYARYNGALVGSEAVPPAAFFDVWQKIARALNGHKALYAYGLMNEPHGTGELWHRVAQSGVDGIRSVDRSHWIFVAGEHFSSTAGWAKVNPLPFVQDPVNLEIYEGHVYFDADSSGKYISSDPIKDPARLVDERVQPFLDWLSANGKRGAIGEWGVPSDDARWLGGATRMLQLSRDNCLPTYVWAGGNWSPGYKLSLEPLKGVDRILTTHLARALERNAP